MRFTIEQYNKAIESLQAAKQQLKDDTQGEGCSVCGGGCHPDLCGHNPLYAQYLCNSFSQQSEVLHNMLHQMSGFDTYMGESIGVASVVKP